MRLWKSGDYRKGADPGTHRVLFVDHDTETELLSNPYSVPRFLVGLGTDSHIFCNICLTACGIGLFVTLQDLVSSLYDK